MGIKRLIGLLTAALLLLLLPACGPGVQEPSEPDFSLTESVSEPEQSTIPVSEISEPDESEPEQDSSDEPSEEPSEPEESGWKAFRDANEIRVETYRASPIPDSGFSITSSSITVGVGKNSPVSYAFKPIGATNRKLVWETGNASIATVSEDGVVTGVSPGSVYVTATTQSGRSASCKVTVVQTDSTALGNLIDRITLGTFAGWSFCYWDFDLDGEKELAARQADPRGIAPEVTIYRVSSGEKLCSFDVGDGEEWGFWNGKLDGEETARSYYLISFKQFPDSSVTRYVIELLLTDAEGKLTTRRLYYRDETGNGTASSKTICYISDPSGTLTETDYDTYQAFRTAFFAANKQQGSNLPFVTGSESESIARSLRKSG